MKIKKLLIHNIASIEDAVIDFTGVLLANEPLFLITGETGSGKTTILNAICLALYNTAPNIEGVQSALYAAKIGGVSINDPLQLMRQGTYDAHVNLVFEGNDSHEYVASWVAHRAKNGNPQSVKTSLTCLYSQLTLQKKREIADAIKSANVVGLTYEQFCRTTMLAQGQFSKFMTSKDDDKSDILEKLTGTELYARIGQKVNERYNAAKEDLTAITNRIAGAKLMTPEEREELNEKVGQLSKDIEEQQKSLDDVACKYEWMKAVETAQTQRQIQAGKLERMKTQLEDKQIQEHGAILLLWDKTSDIRNTLKSVREKSSQLAASEIQLKEKQTEFTSIVAGLEYVKGQLSAANTDVANLKVIQESESKHAKMYGNIQRIESLIDTIVSKRKVVRNQDAQIESANKEKQAKEEPLSKANTTVKEAMEALASAHKLVEEKVATARIVNIEELRKRTQDCEKDGKFVEECIVATTDLRKKIQTKENADKTLSELKAQTAQAAKQKETQEALLPEAKRETEAFSNQLKGKMDLLAHLVELQERFHDTGICPLCGSAVNGIHAESILDEEVAKAKDLATAAENRQKAIEKSISEAETILQTTQKPLERAIKASADASIEEESAMLTTGQLLSRFQFLWDDDDLDEKLQRLKNTYDQRLTDAQQQLADGQAKLDAIEPVRKEEDKRRAALEEAKGRVDQIKKDVELIENKIRESRMLGMQAQNDEEEAVNALSPMLSIVVDLQNANLLSLKAEVRSKAESFAKNAEKIRVGEQKLSELKTLIASIMPTVIELAEVLGMETNIAAKEQKDLEQKLRTFNVEVTKLNGSINTLKEQLQAEERSAEEFFNTHSDISKDSVVSLLDIQINIIQNYREEKRKIEDEIKQTEGAITQIDGQLTELQRQKPELKEEDSLEMLSNAKSEKGNQMKLLNNKRVEIMTRLKDDTERAKAQVDDIQKKEQLQHLTNNWKILNDAFGGKDGDRFKRIAQSYVLRSLLQKANYYLRMLNTRYELTCTDGSLSISILDQAQGGAERNVSSLSGGEGFVVSLALALGLSAISKDKINVDTLFIDEGFGTLSGDYLETVINTLDKLHQLGGRRVGIISHVAELAHRIPTQIQVKRTGPSSSKIEIVSL